MLRSSNGFFCTTGGCSYQNNNDNAFYSLSWLPVQYPVTQSLIYHVLVTRKITKLLIDQLNKRYPNLSC